MWSIMVHLMRSTMIDPAPRKDLIRHPKSRMHGLQSKRACSQQIVACPVTMLIF
jgi:hypothetical protein